MSSPEEVATSTANATAKTFCRALAARILDGQPATPDDIAKAKEALGVTPASSGAAYGECAGCGIMRLALENGAVSLPNCGVPQDELRAAAAGTMPHIPQQPGPSQLNN